MDGFNQSEVEVGASHGDASVVREAATPASPDRMPLVFDPRTKSYVRLRLGPSHGFGRKPQRRMPVNQNVSGG